MARTLTIQDGALLCPYCGARTRIQDEGSRLWSLRASRPGRRPGVAAVPASVGAAAPGSPGRAESNPERRSYP